MSESLARTTDSPPRGPVRPGRPRREFAGEVEERILDAAAKVFLDRGFEGATIDEVAEEARAGKPTIYARFPGKEALFTAVVARKVHENTSPVSVAATGSTTEERLKALAEVILERALGSDTLGLMRVTVAEARRFPDLASSVQRMARERGQVDRPALGRVRQIRRDGSAAGVRPRSPAGDGARFRGPDPLAYDHARPVRGGPCSAASGDRPACFAVCRVLSRRLPIRRRPNRPRPEPRPIMKLQSAVRRP